MTHAELSTSLFSPEPLDLIAALDLAADLGGEVVTFHLGGPVPNVPLTDVWQRTVATLREAVASADIADRLRQEGALTNDTIGNTPADFTRWIATEYERWGRVIKETGIKVQ